MSHLIKRYQKHFLVFMISFMTGVVIFALQGVIWNDASILVSDGYKQYYELILYMRQVLYGSRSFFFTMSVGGGMETLPTIAYYLLSPFNFIFALIPTDWVEWMMHVVILAKIALAASTMYALLHSEHPKTSFLITAAFALCYSLSGWAIGYCFEIMWLDNLYLLPVILLGINRYIDGKKPWMFGIALAVSILSNYYLGWIVVGFSILYFASRINVVIDDKALIASKWAGFLISMLGSVLTTGIIMWPLVSTMVGTFHAEKRLGVLFGTQGWDSYAKLFYGTADPDFNNQDTSYLYSGVFTAVLGGAYFFNHGVSHRRKKWAFILWGILAVSVFFTPFYNIWHAFRAANVLQGRFSFLFILINIVMAAEEYEHRKTARLIDYLIPVLTYIVIGIITRSLAKPEYLSWWAVLGTVLFALFYAGIMGIRIHIRPHTKQLLIFMVVFAELFTNALIALGAWQMEDYSYIERMPSLFAQGAESVECDGYCRVVDGNEYSPFQNVGTQYNSTTLYSSSIAYNHYEATHALGYPNAEDAYWYSDDTSEIADILMDHNYVISDDNRSYYEKTDSFRRVYPTNKNLVDYEEERIVWKNPLAFGIGTMVNEPTAEYDGDPLAYQNDLFKAMTGMDEDVYTEVPLTKTDIGWDYEAEEGADYYLYADFDTRDLYTIKVELNDRQWRLYDDSWNRHDSDYIHLPKRSGTIKITFTLSNGTKLVGEPKLYRLNGDVLKKGAETLKERAMTSVSVQDEGVIDGTVTATSEAPFLYLSTAYNGGWSAEVDGRPAETIQAANGMLGMLLSPGRHEIHLEYHQRNWFGGVALTVSGIVLLILYSLVHSHMERSFADTVRPHLRLLRIIGIVVLSCIYTGWFLLMFLYPGNASSRVTIVLVYLITVWLHMFYHRNIPYLQKFIPKKLRSFSYFIDR